MRQVYWHEETSSRGWDMESLELKLLRVKAGLTQGDLAQQLRIHPARISEMERGRRAISQDIERSLERIFGVATSG